MSNVLERLNRALAPELNVEREIASGGMGIVFAARDTTLDRQVAIKIIRPEQATARAAEKFLREARILANLRHPNVVPVHRAGEAEGLFYYVMDFVSEGTLSERLTRGPLPQQEALKLGRDLLDALEPVHDQGVVHRDIKPSNIFLIGNRAVLTDFGIARPTQDPADITVTDAGLTGTPGYMPPEQAYGQPVTGRTDLYAVAMVLYEAYTGRRWSDTPPDAKPNWSGVPGKVVPVLRQALAWDPKKRWPDAATFRRALWRTRTLRYKRYKWYATAVAAATLVIGWLIGRYVLQQQHPMHDLAILQFAAEPANDSVLNETADRLRDLTRFHLENFARTAPLSHVDVVLQTRIGTAASIGEGDLAELGVQYAAHGTVTATGDSIEIAISVIDSLGEPTNAGTVKALAGAFNWERTAHEIGFRIAQVVDPNRTYEGSEALAHRSNAAITAFATGRRAFKRNAFRTAEWWFREALEEDPSFGLAAWWLSNAWNWQLKGEPAPEVDLAELLETHGAGLSERTRNLISARIAPTPTRRFEIYREVIDDDPRDAYVAAMYSEELYNRGALSGFPLEFTISQLEDAVRKDSTFGPALGSLARSYIRSGNQVAAEQAVESYTTHYPVQTGEEDGFDEFNPDLLQWALAERFYSAEIKNATRDLMLAQPGILNAIPQASRLAPMLGLSTTQAELAYIVLSGNQLLPLTSRASLHESRALGLVALGRINEALLHLDSAAALLDTPSARLEAEEWRVIASTIGMPEVQTADGGSSRNELERLRAHPAVENRAIWALGLEAMSIGDGERVESFLDTLLANQRDTTAERLGTLLNALQLASTGRFRQALAVSQRLLAYDSAAHGGDPFARAVLHLKRADWLDSLGDLGAADSTRLWYEHFEIVRKFEGAAQAAEIDWALSTFAMWLRGVSAAASGDRLNACTHLPRVAELWAESDPPYAELRDSASALVTNLGCRR
jgi:hypothetical protein